MIKLLQSQSYLWSWVVFQSLSYNFFLLIPLICKIKKQNIPTHKRYIWSEFIDISLIFYTVSLLTKKELIVKRTCKSRMVYLKHVLFLKRSLLMFMHKIYFLELFIFIGSEALRTITLSSCRYPYWILRRILPT